MDVNQYIGMPFKDKGRTRKGADCWGLVRIVYAIEYGIDLPSYNEDYPSSTEAEEIGKLINCEKGKWYEIPAGKEKAGDIIIMRLSGHPTHVGVIAWPGYMLHTLKGVNTVLEHYTGILWRNRVVGIFRHEGLK
jgi:cell wall-associated NlpC family hydrolase